MKRRPLLLAATASMLPLGGCVATKPRPTALVNNTRLSDTLKARSFKSYKEVLLVPPLNDPRGLGGRLKTELEALGYPVRLMPAERPIDGTQGTAFVIGADGWVLTCAHVVGNEKLATLTLDGQRHVADVIKSDRKADLALLKLREPLAADAAVLSFRAAERAAVMGEEVYTIGYPLSRLLGRSARMSRGQLSATAGLRDNPGEVQVSAQIHPGNSGGPLLDKDGQVIGVVNKVINPGAVQAATGGALPQNINFAIKARPVLDFLREAEPRAYGAVTYDRSSSLETASKAIARIHAGLMAPDEQRRERLEILFGPTRLPLTGSPLQPVMALLALDHETKESHFTLIVPVPSAAAMDDATFSTMMSKLREAMAAR
jgi:S1-C subfamily serine protease